MNTAIADQINKAFAGLSETHIRLRSKQKIVDKDISDHYHVLEMITMTAPQISKVTKSLRTLLRERRDIKESLSVIDSALSWHITISDRRSRAVGEYEAEAKQSFSRIMGQWNEQI